MHVIVIFTFLSLVSQAKILGLNDLFLASKQNIETLKKSDSLLVQSLESKRQAEGALLPTIRFVATETRIDSPKSAMVNRAFVLTRQYSTALRLEQPLLRGGAIAALKLTDEEYLLQNFLKSYQEKILYQLVLRNYFDFLKAKIDLETFEELRLLSSSREKELKYLTSLGRSRKSELIQAEAQTLSVQASIHQAKMYYQKVKENLIFFAGQDFEDVMPLDKHLQELEPLGYYQRKLNSSPDFLAKIQEIKIADHQIDLAKGGHLPNLDFFTNYYFDRTGILQTSEWDFGIQLSFPIFQGGIVQSQVREAVENKKLAEISKTELDRSLMRDLNILYQNYGELKEQVKQLKNASQKAEESYKLNLKDYRMGLITNLEVLQSLNLYVDLKRNLKNLINETHYQIKNLHAFVGEWP